MEEMGDQNNLQVKKATMISQIQPVKDNNDDTEQTANEGLQNQSSQDYEIKVLKS